VLNQNPGADPLRYVSANPRTRRLLGPRFAVLREGFARWRGWLRAHPARARRLLVTFGGSDPARLTLRAVQALREIRDLEVEIVLAAEHPDAAEIARLCANSALRLHHRVTEMPELIAGCDFALTAAGSTTLECAFLQTPQLLVTVAENQRPLAAGLVAGGAAELLGWHTEVTAAAITEAVSSLRDDLERRTAMSRAAARLVDGFGSARVVAQMRGDLLSLRSATGPDDRLVFGWANDPASRAASFASEEIPWETHRDWFARRLADPATRLWIGDDERGPIGVVRFDLAAEEATISINLAPEARGFGFGSALIARASRELIASTATRRIHAFIKPGNHASVAAFIAADYEQLAATTQREQPAEHFAFPAAA
jgi:L-amino acid N-acyltransferase YncA